MKKIALFLVTILTITALQANSKRVQEPKKIVEGDSSKEYSKPGAPIDIKYSSSKVDVNQTSDINITLTTTAKMGKLDVLISLDDNLSLVGNVEDNLTFQISPDIQDFSIKLQVKSNYESIYYIKLLTKIDKGHGVKLRSFAIPVYVGEIPKNLVHTSSQMKALANGENISISKAVETIKVIK